jgi:hypothetical protein
MPMTLDQAGGKEGPGSNEQATDLLVVDEGLLLDLSEGVSLSMVLI